MFDTRNYEEEIMEMPGAVILVQRIQNRLTEEQKKREEFYNLIDEDSKAEFINGEIVFHSPVKKEHNDATKWLFKLADTFVAIYQLGYVGIEKILTKFTRNDYEPDVCFFGNEKAADFKKGQMIFPVPDLAIEVLSKSRESIRRDREIKFEDYQSHGVSEYWIIDAEEEFVEQYWLENGRFQLLLKSGEGMIRSRAMTGFAIPIRAIFDEEANLAALREMLLQTPENH